MYWVSVLELARYTVRGLIGSVILHLLYRNPMHGYEIVNRIKELTGHSFGPGTIYPILYRMEEHGLIKSSWKKIGRRRMIKLYSLTEKGVETLNELKALWREKLVKLIHSIIGH